VKTQNRQLHKGSALILVIVVTVLLAVVGVMFLMISRAGQMESAAVIQSKDLDAAVQTVLSRIDDVLVADLFGTNPARPGIADAGNLNPDSDEPWDLAEHHRGFNNGLGVDGIAGTWDDMIDPGPDGQLDPAQAPAANDDVWLPGLLDDYWLASLEPVWWHNNNTPADPTDDIYVWPHISDLWGTIQGASDSLYYQRFDRGQHVYYPQTAARYWLDPDNSNVPSQWSTAPGVWEAYKVSAYNVRAKIIRPKDRMKIILQGAAPNVSEWNNPASTCIYGARADADGDGVADSRWVLVPGLTTSRGEPVFAAVRIIDNCAMLNLNAASCFNVKGYADPKKRSPFSDMWTYWHEDPVNTFTLKPWHDNQKDGSGRYLTEINYLPFLRGRDLNGVLFDGGASGESGDRWYDLMAAKGLAKVWGGNIYPFAPAAAQAFLLNMEKPLAGRFFDIGDELELRNRYLITSMTEARFERKSPPDPGVLHFTLDAGGGTYGALRTPVDENTAFVSWKIKVDPANFDKWDLAGNPLAPTNPLFRYDRRHLCTFYSFDRMFRRGGYPLLEADLAGIPAGSRGRIRSLLIPAGPVSTDIASPAEILKGTSGKPYNTIETRRRILQLLYAMREYFFQQNGGDLHEAALSAAQFAANVIDFSDDGSPNSQVPGESEGPFYHPDYGAQANVDCTFITEDIIDKMLAEVTGGLVPAGAMPFGLETDDIVFGYERQPFISEVYAKRNVTTGVLEEFAIELLNPYPDDLKLARIDTAYTVNEDAWRIKVGDGAVINAAVGDLYKFVPKYDDQTAQSPGRYVIRSSAAVTLASGPLASLTYELASLLQINTVTDKEIQLLRPAPAWIKNNRGIDYIVVDKVSGDTVASMLLLVGQNAVKRQDTEWKFIYGRYALQQTGGPSPNYTHTLGQANSVTVPGAKGFQLAAADDGRPLCRWHELETLPLYGNGPENTSDPNAVITAKLTAADTSPLHLDLIQEPAVLDYICTINRPDSGTLPGRININTAPLHVIAAAIPPVLADPNAADPDKTVTFSSLQLAEEIIQHRPYAKLADLLTKVPRMKQYSDGPWKEENVGMQSISDDIEEEHWILSNLANKFTVRSDVFTAYILVRLGEDGPQRRMIAVFDRSQVWTKNDRPKLVALHPVADPR